MDEQQRLQRLDALGIDVYVRRGTPQPTAPATAAPAARPAVDAAAAPVAGIVTDPRMLGWPELRAAVAACTQCELHRTRTQTVFGVGDPSARVMFIGEAPGAEEDRQGEPFVGRAGQLLTQMIRALGLARSEVFIANVLKCRPPGNRDPSDREAACCRPFLERQIELVDPALIVAVGRIAAQTLLGSEAPLGKLRSRVHEFGPARRPLIVTYHPAYLLRSPAEKRRAWQDLQFVLRTLRDSSAAPARVEH
jgi:DNA polymerase